MSTRIRPKSPLSGLGQTGRRLVEVGTFQGSVSEAEEPATYTFEVENGTVEPAGEANPHDVITDGGVAGKIFAPGGADSFWVTGTITNWNPHHPSLGIKEHAPSTSGGGGGGDDTQDFSDTSGDGLDVTDDSGGGGGGGAPAPAPQPRRRSRRPAGMLAQIPPVVKWGALAGGGFLLVREVLNRM